jgi:acetyl-CoA carboxylase carboxyl transferase subunit beta
MNWLTNYVKPKLRGLVPRKNIPDNMWSKCPSCGGMIFTKELEKNNMVCNHCDHHLRLPAVKRLEMLFDDGNYNKAELPGVSADPLKFKDLKKYSDRIKESRKKTGEDDAIVVGYGSMGGMQVVIGVIDFRFMGGSMGRAVGEGIVAAAELAVLQEAPLILIPSSGGARMQEGILSLMQMARTTVAVSRVKEKGLPYICVLTDPTTGGVTASFAMLGDVHIAEQGCAIGFAGARVIEQTIRETLPEGFQTAEYLKEHGMVDVVVHRKELKEKLVSLLSLLTNTKPAGALVDFKNNKK